MFVCWWPCCFLFMQLLECNCLEVSSWILKLPSKDTTISGTSFSLLCYCSGELLLYELLCHNFTIHFIWLTFSNTLCIYIYNRCATGEAWPDIMLDASSGRECDPLAVNYNQTTGNSSLSDSRAWPNF